MDLDFSLVDDVLSYIDIIDTVEEVAIPRTYIRDAENILERFNDEEFVSKFKFTKETVRDRLIPLIQDEFTLDKHKWDRRGLPVPVPTEMCTALSFYATGSMQSTCGDEAKISQATVCRVIKDVSAKLAQLLPVYVKFPDQTSLKQKFCEISGFPEVIGCIGCTHIPVKSPGGENYRNSQGWMSLNIQIVAGPQFEILDIITTEPGSTKDSVIFDQSYLKHRLEKKKLDGLLLGHAGYTQSPYMFTPVDDPQTESERMYNEAHKNTWVTVQRLFAIWKNRFSCLKRKLFNNQENIQSIIAACAVLHNIGRQTDQMFEDFDIEQPVSDLSKEVYNKEGREIREQFIIRHFS